MIVAAHQPHYFPWLGFFDKMAKVDRFILMDEVQLTYRSRMFRNKFLTKSGNERYLTVSFSREGFMNKSFTEVPVNTHVDWQVDHANFLKDTYGKTPGFKEIWPRIEPVFTTQYQFVSDVALDSVAIMKDLLDIPTETVLQSSLTYDHSAVRNGLILALCQAAHADSYLCGRGAQSYMEIDTFDAVGITVVYQSLESLVYPQISSQEFVPGLSALDLLFNCGITQGRAMFWDNVRASSDWQLRTVPEPGSQTT